jgi:hypothetical protein
MIQMLFPLYSAVVVVMFQMLYQTTWLSITESPAKKYNRYMSLKGVFFCWRAIGTSSRNVEQLLVTREKLYTEISSFAHPSWSFGAAIRAKDKLISSLYWRWHPRFAMYVLPRNTVDEFSEWFIYDNKHNECSIYQSFTIVALRYAGNGAHLLLIHVPNHGIYAGFNEN